jgi:hypothetical protein
MCRNCRPGIDGQEQRDSKRDRPYLSIAGWRKVPYWKSRQKMERIDYDPNAKYNDRELEQLADQLLREDAKAVDPETGKERGIGGKDPILFAEHEYARRRREIYTEGGTPDPSLVSGMYNRTHPQGRKVNSDEQRSKNGASYYR